MSKTKLVAAPAPRTDRVALTVDIRDNLHAADQSCRVIFGGVATLHAIANFASEVEMRDRPVPVDWCGLEELLEAIKFELLEGPFSGLQGAINSALRAEEPAGGAR